MLTMADLRGRGAADNDDAVVRLAVPADFEAIRAIAAAANEEFRGPMGDSLFAGYLENVLDVERRASGARLLVAELDGRVVGTITLYPDANDEGMPIRFPDGTAGLRATAVSPDARGRGIGQALVRELLAQARAVGAARIALHTATCMVAAMRLYQRSGFERTPEYDYLANDYFGGDASVSMEAIAFTRDL